MAPAQDSTANVMMTVADALHRHIAGYTHLYILILKRLHIESNGGYGLDRLVWFVLEAVEDSGFPRIVQTEDKNANFFRAE